MQYAATIGSKKYQNGTSGSTFYATAGVTLMVQVVLSRSDDTASVQVSYMNGMYFHQAIVCFY